jgi:serine phosphatase RsbU (regulator of sigma subunit)
MALRFQTRLALAMSILLFIVISVMGMFVIWSAVDSNTENYMHMGRAITALTTRNIDYAVTLPEKVMDRVGDQMSVSALLAAEFVAVAEGEAGLSPEEISRRLRRVVDRSKGDGEDPQVDEIWVTDENGRIYIGSKDSTFSFTPDPETNPQASEFWPLLEGETDVIEQAFQTRDEDEQRFKYVGASGVDKPRIVQVGAGERLAMSVQDEFDVQHIVDRFILDLDFVALAVVDMQGTVHASAVAPGGGEREPLAPNRIQAVVDFLRKNPDPVAATMVGRDIAVVTRLRGPNNEALALYMLHDTQRGLLQLRDHIIQFSLLSALMFLLGVVVCLRVSRRFSKPIAELTAGVAKFGDGDFDHRVHVEAHDEIEALADSFNSMATSLQDYVEELKHETKHRERLQSELNIAAGLQQSLLPVDPPQAHGVDLVGMCRPAREVGGDFYDVLDMGEGRLGIAVGDATGKGLSAALLITECWSAFKALAEVDMAPSELLRRTNNALCRQVGASGRFVTLFFAVIDVRAGTLCYAMAGHNPPVMVGTSPDRRRVLSSEVGLPLGVHVDAAFEDTVVPLEPGDTLLLFSDGLCEARNAANELYGDDRVLATLEMMSQDSPATILDGMTQDADRHMNGSELADDMTIVAIRFSGTGVPV